MIVVPSMHLGTTWITPIRESQYGHESYYKMQNVMALHMGYIEKGKGLTHTTTMWPYYETSLIKNLPTMKRMQKRNNGRIP